MRLVGSTQAATQPALRGLPRRGRSCAASFWSGVEGREQNGTAEYLPPSAAPTLCFQLEVLPGVVGIFIFLFVFSDCFKNACEKKQTNKTHTQRREGFMVRENASVSNGAKRVVQLIPMFRVFLSSSVSAHCGVSKSQSKRREQGVKHCSLQVQKFRSIGSGMSRKSDRSLTQT